MKAKVIKTGEVVDVYHEPQHGQITNIYKESVFVNGRIWTENELDFSVKVNEAPKKIYIDDFGSELSYDWHTEHVYETSIEYTRTDAFIDKACDYLMEYEFNDSPTIADRRKRVDEFRNYMKGVRYGR